MTTPRRRYCDSVPSTADRSKLTRPPLRRVAAGLVVAGALFVTGCGDDSSGSGGQAAAVDEGGSPLAAEAVSTLPLINVADGAEVALGDVAASDRPTLLWFWAPH